MPCCQLVLSVTSYHGELESPAQHRKQWELWCSRFYGRLIGQAIIFCRYGFFLWPPCILDADIIFLSRFFFFLSCFSRLISSVADWMSTILPHMMWLYCEFRMQVWNVLHAARRKYRTQKNRHLGTIAQLCQAMSSQLKHVSTIGKKLGKQQYVLRMQSCNLHFRV